MGLRLSAQLPACALIYNTCKRKEAAARSLLYVGDTPDTALLCSAIPASCEHFLCPNPWLASPRQRKKDYSETKKTKRSVQTNVWFAQRWDRESRRTRVVTERRQCRRRWLRLRACDSGHVVPCAFDSKSQEFNYYYSDHLGQKTCRSACTIRRKQNKRTPTVLPAFLVVSPSPRSYV